MHQVDTKREHNNEKHIECYWPDRRLEMSRVWRTQEWNLHSSETRSNVPYRQTGIFKIQIRFIIAEKKENILWTIQNENVFALNLIYRKNYSQLFSQALKPKCQRNCSNQFH
jgi:hypothetical protein